MELEMKYAVPGKDICYLERLPVFNADGSVK